MLRVSGVEGLGYGAFQCVAVISSHHGDEGFGSCSLLALNWELREAP